MTVYRFTAYLAGVREITDADADRLFEAGCDDGTPGSRDGMAFVGFSREADSLDAALRSAIANLSGAGYCVERVELERDDLEELAQSASGQRT